MVGCWLVEETSPPDALCAPHPPRFLRRPGQQQGLQPPPGLGDVLKKSGKSKEKKVRPVISPFPSLAVVS